MRCTQRRDGKTITRRLTEDEARLYQEWIANDRQHRALITKMRQVAAKATDLILKRFVANEPLYRVHERVFGVLALESEPVDPRL